MPGFPAEQVGKDARGPIRLATQMMLEEMAATADADESRRLKSDGEDVEQKQDEPDKK